jgi:hypothetical protein
MTVHEKLEHWQKAISNYCNYMLRNAKTLTAENVMLRTTNNTSKRKYKNFQFKAVLGFEQEAV